MDLRNTMQKKLKSSGNGWEFYFTKPILKLLGYNPTEVRLLITSKNSCLYIKPVTNKDISKYENNMVRKLQKSGSSYSLYLPTPLIEVLEINPETDYINVAISNDEFVISKFMKE